MNRNVLDLREIDRTQVAIAGGKGAQLGELARVKGVSVPGGFVITTRAFQRAVADAPSVAGEAAALARATPDDAEAIRSLAARLRSAIESAPVPSDLASDITAAVARLGERTPCAVRSSATAEDMPTASFAGQQDTYLNVIGEAEVLRHVSRCWASLFTERAVIYRMRNGMDASSAFMAVVVQRMVFPEASGILFTADPITGNRNVVSIDASFGLGEALVSGIVNADVYKVRDASVIARTIATKRLAILPTAGGGTHEQAIESGRQQEPALTDAQAVRLAEIGRRIEAHFGAPQDIEWCLVDGQYQIVQSRPITTLFPIPAAADAENHVYLSVGHQQMMTDAMKPLGLSVWQLTTPRPMAEAGGRLFVDVTSVLESPASRTNLLAAMGQSDPLMRDALETVLERPGFIRTRPDDGPAWKLPGTGAAAPVETDPRVVEQLIAQSEASIAEAKRAIETRSGSDVLDFILADIEEMRRVQFDPRVMQVIMAGMQAAWWLNDKLQQWLGEKNVADTLSQSVANNVTSEMGLALLDVADVIRPHAEVVAFLERVEKEEPPDARFLERLTAAPGGREARDAIMGWLERYGMRGVGEIDITRPRFAERPAMLVPLLLGNVRNFQPGEAKRRFARGLEEASRKEQDVLSRLGALPEGDEKARETKAMIDRVRAFAGFREYPKYAIVSRYFVYKRALMKEAGRLVDSGVLAHPEDVFFLRFQELHDVTRTGRADHEAILARREAFRFFQALKPPRVLTSEGEGLRGSYRRGDVPPGALVGLPVSSGMVEGRARVVMDIASADLDPGDILVTAYTDPSWTPLFVSLAGLVTEVGGLMTHGAVIAREYGLPAIVGVVDATRLIRDGQQIRVHGTEGYVEILSG